MAFTGNGQRLIGDDGYIQEAEFGAEVLGDGLTPLPVGTYVVIKVAASSGFPAPADGGDSIAAGDVLVVETGASITPATDDNVVTLTLTDKCDVSSWSTESTKEEVETTVLCDSQKKYRAGKADTTGTVEGLFVTGTTDDKEGLLREFYKINRQDGDASYDSFAQRRKVYFAFLYVNFDSSFADKMWLGAPIEFYGNGSGGEIGSSQTFSSPFRYGDLTYTSAAGDDISIEPTFYRLGDGT